MIDREIYNNLIDTTNTLKIKYKENKGKDSNILIMSPYTYSYFEFDIVFNGLNIVVLENMQDWLLEVGHNENINYN
jgi:hypothetical protein